MQIEGLRAQMIAGRAEALRKVLSSCMLCPRRCKADRLRGKMGFCHIGTTIKIARAVPHIGEEPVISGTHGAGTIFFSGCHLGCVYCQNFQISHEGLGSDFTVDGLATVMLGLKERGCHNIELVSATHVLPFVLEALAIAVDRGLDLPVVLNSGGFEAPETIAMLDGIVDIYLPDAKYALADVGLDLSGVSAYPHWNELALDEMVRQVGTSLEIRDGVAVRGIIVRHLILPGYIENSKAVLKWLADRYGTDVHLSLMSQYFPAYKAGNHPILSRRLRKREYEEVVGYALELGFKNGWIQEFDDRWPLEYPDFRLEVDTME
ncbi:MAG: radical SAM protein [Dissulfurimicrobium sp.]|uniref:radical SAM protein n=1 Tax=Dissulfurimicrobium TaxID=1769732 RepID=UPI001EDA54DC|nr:radical SAM protein [Dissulfurimicrobium hydrothermale]UKL13444.1 radical SAM protein [Dissulfurimicrobium hydrothermale]